ncbi:aminotransferase class IV family protein [Nocardia rhamnosiphila]|uniref:aminotransferase class IV family protein n=1 Tax=Nocardia rhamnosiphila TaxID=426716 RepID=UPI0004C41D92|nr:aminotransferase class IV family protein [Nocardia rhamnosiphila]
MTVHTAQVDGRDAAAAELAPLAFAGFAHFTAAQVRDHRIRGLDLHLDRLRAASEEFFGRALPDDRVRGYLRAALDAGPADVSLTATVFSRPGEFVAVDDALSVLVRTGPPASGPTGPLALATVEYERPVARVKHVGEVAKTYYLRQAVQQGFDDAAFVDRAGRFSEATIWNLAFWDGDSVVWPEAEMLLGTTMGIVRRQLDRLGVPQRTVPVTPGEVAGLAGAVVMNSWTPAVSVHRIGTTDLPPAPDFAELLHRAYSAEPLVAP